MRFHPTRLTHWRLALASRLLPYSSRRGIAFAPTGVTSKRPSPASKQTLASDGGVTEGTAFLRHLAEYNTQPIGTYSLEELLQLHALESSDRIRHLESVLHIGISRIITLLRGLPLGLSNAGPIREVIRDYARDLRELKACSERGVDAERFRMVLSSISGRHLGMMGRVAKGLQEFQAELRLDYRPFSGLQITDCAGLDHQVPAVRGIEAALDEFFTIRTTLRLLITHCMQQAPASPGASSMQGSLVQASDVQASDEGGAKHIGAICLDTRPSLVLIEAYQHAHFMCRRQFGHAPALFVNEVPVVEYLREGSKLFELDEPIPYVDIHLYFIFFEVLKNALLTSVLSTGPHEKPPPIHATLISGTSYDSENERTIKISDFGEGIKRKDIRKIWSYFHSTVTSDAHSDEQSDEGALPFVSGRGLGLPVSRVLARYFGGDMDVHSLPRKGTDVYIYL